ncbi:MAG TPA: alpha/beta hydrolase [Bryobacteraceae bacterium]|nr:alpha/beta hydrolase [Bryobacteraceae bacterium]
MATAHINGVELYYETAGDGPPLLLLHGLGSSTLDWEFQIPDLARSHRVIAMDVRGHGRSSKPPGPYTVAQFAKDAVALLETLHATPADIVGLSMGGMIAFQMAVDAPASVRSLTIVNSGPAMILQTFGQRMLIQSRFAMIRLFGMRALGKMVAGPLFPNPDQAHLRERFITHLAENDPRAYRASLRAIVGWSVAERIGQIRCPVLVVASDHDYTPVALKQAYVGKIPGARLRVLNDSRHAAPLDQPDQLNRAVLEFLSEARS